MKDCAGVTLEIGQIVATNYSGYTSGLELCKVLALTPQKVKLRRELTCQEIYKFPEQLAVVRLA